MNAFALRAAELTEHRPKLAAAVRPLLTARVAIEQQIAGLDRKVIKFARSNAQVQRFMTAPGIGPITVLCFLTTIDDPTRFNDTTLRIGEIDWTGRISKCGDKMLRGYLYEAANGAAHTRSKMVSPQSLGHSACKTGYAKPKLRLRENLPSFCIGCGSMVPNLDGHQRSRSSVCPCPSNSARNTRGLSSARKLRSRFGHDQTRALPHSASRLLERSMCPTRPGTS